jgi:hypothetical protein
MPKTGHTTKEKIEAIRQQIGIVEDAEETLLKAMGRHKGADEAQRYLNQEQAKLQTMAAEIEAEIEQTMPSLEQRRQDLLSTLRKQVDSCRKLVKLSGEMAETIELLRWNASEIEQLLGQLSPLQQHESKELVGTEHQKIRRQILLERRERYPELPGMDISLVYACRDLKAITKELLRKLQQNIRRAQRQDKRQG